MRTRRVGEIPSASEGRPPLGFTGTNSGGLVSTSSAICSKSAGVSTSPLGRGDGSSGFANHWCSFGLSSRARYLIKGVFDRSCGDSVTQSRSHNFNIDHPKYCSYKSRSSASKTNAAEKPSVRPLRRKRLWPSIVANMRGGTTTAAAPRTNPTRSLASGDGGGRR